jgi:hypothetical protein
MSARRFLILPALQLLAFTAAASAQTYDGPSSVIPTRPRAPVNVYQRMRIPPDRANVPQAPPSESSASRAPERPRCKGTGCPPTEVAVAQHLLVSGPDTTEIYGMFERPAYQFAVVGFVKEGWPVSVEYVAQPDTVTVLRVKLYHERKILIFPLPFFEVAFEANLDALDAEKAAPVSDNPWHRTVDIPAIALSREADPAASSGLHVARYELRSYRLIDGQVTNERAPLDVLGITVGPDVVGSLTLYGAEFDNSKYQIPQSDDPATELPFRYRADRNYDLLKERIEHYSEQELAYEVMAEIGTPHSAAANQTFAQKWRVKRNLPPGIYRASVIGWWDCQGVPVLQKLDSCPNNPNWAVADSGDVELFR